MSKPPKAPPVTRIRAIREQAGISQIELAVSGGVSLSTLRKLENAADPLELALTGVGHFVALAESLGTTAADLYPLLGVKRRVK